MISKISASIFAVAAAVASAQSSANWEVVPSPTFESQGVVLRAAFSKDGVHGYAGGGKASGGGQVIKTDDSGKTWKEIFPLNQSKFDLNLFLTTQVRDAEHAIMAGAFYNAYTQDGKKVDVSIDYFHSPAQGSGIIPGDDEFAIISGKETIAGGNSIGVSKTGFDYSKIVLPDSVLNSTDFLARYGAFPSEKVWYITAGSFPTQEKLKKGDKKVGMGSLNKHIRLDTTAMSVQWAEGDELPKSKDDGYSAGIMKTTDGGKTWEAVFKNFKTGDDIYPNGIDCFTEDHCIAVLEGNSARIIVTHDGGKTWKQTLMDDDPHSSLMDVKMLSATEAWAVGGHPAQEDFEGRFYHSLDGGNTWEKEVIKGLYVISMDMLTSKTGYAVSFTNTQPAGIKLLKYSPASK